MAELSLHTFAGYGILVGLLFLAVCGCLWRGLNDGFMAGLTLPVFLGTSVLLVVISAGVWWATK